MLYQIAATTAIVPPEALGRTFVDVTQLNSAASRKGAGMLHVMAVITAVAGQRPALLAAIKENIPAVLAEAGCIEYVATVDAEIGGMQAPFGPDTLVVVEKWASAEALQAHAVSPHMAAYNAKTKHLVATRAIHVLSPA